MCVCVRTHSHNSLLELHKASTRPEKTLNTEWRGRGDGCPFLKFSLCGSFPGTTYRPQTPNTFAWNHFIRNINFIKETGEPEKKRSLTCTLPSKKTTHNWKQREHKRLSVLLQVWKRIRDLPVRARLLKYLQVSRAEVIFSHGFFYICLLHIWKGDCSVFYIQAMAVIKRRY